MNCLSFYTLPDDMQVLIFSHIRKDQIARRILRRFRLRKLDAWWMSIGRHADMDLYQFMNFYNWDHCQWALMKPSEKEEVYAFYIKRKELRYKQEYTTDDRGLEIMRSSYDYYRLTEEEDKYFSQPHHANYICHRCITGFIDDTELKQDQYCMSYCPSCEHESDEDSDDY